MKITLAVLTALVVNYPQYSVSAQSNNGDTSQSPLDKAAPPHSSNATPPTSPEHVFIPMPSAPYPTLEDRHSFEKSLPPPVYIPHPDEVVHQYSQNGPYISSPQSFSKRHLSAQERRDIELKRSLYSRVLVRCPVTATNPSYHQLQALGYRLQQAKRFNEAQRCFDDARAVYTSRVSLFGHKQSEKPLGEEAQKAAEQGYGAGKDNLSLLNMPGMPVDPLLRKVHRQANSNILYDDPVPAGGYQQTIRKKSKKRKGKRRGVTKGRSPRQRRGKAIKTPKKDGKQRQDGQQQQQNTSTPSPIPHDVPSPVNPSLIQENAVASTASSSTPPNHQANNQPQPPATTPPPPAGTTDPSTPLPSPSPSLVPFDVQSQTIQAPSPADSAAELAAADVNPDPAAPLWRRYTARAWATVPVLRRRLMQVYNTQLRIQQEQKLTPM